MKAIVFADFGEVEVADVPEPKLEEPTDAILKVTTGAICGSDLHVLHGKIPGMTPGSVLGHECVGVIEEVGPEVRGFAAGDRVVASFQVVCGECWYCRRGEFNICDDLRVLGYGAFLGDLGGAQAEYVRIPKADLNLIEVPDGLSDEQAVFAGDILTTGYYAAKIGGVGPGDTVCVVGAGPVGMFSMLCSRLLDPRQVIVVDMVQGRLDLAAKLGAETINASDRNPSVAIDDFTEGRGADVVIDAVGGGAAPLLSALDLVRPGGTVSVIGVHADLQIEFPIGEVWRKHLTIVMGGSCNVQGYWAEVLEHVAAGRLDPTVIVSHTMTLAEGVKAYEMFDRREAQKIVLKP